MSTTQHSTHQGVVSSVQRFVRNFDPAQINATQRRRAIQEIDALLPLLCEQSVGLAAALMPLRAKLASEDHALTSHSVPPTNSSVVGALDDLFRKLAPIALAAGAMAMPLQAAATPYLAFSAAVSSSLVVGDTVTNPDTGLDEVIVETIGSPTYAVRTASDNIILLATTVGDTYTVVDQNNVSTTYEVTAVTLNGSGQVTSITVKDTADTNNPPATSSIDIVQAINIADPGGTDGTGAQDVSFPTATGDVNTVRIIRKGTNGSNGRDGGGLEICFFGCVIIGVSPKPGGAGADGPTINETISSGTTTTTSNNSPGIIVASIGGDGGDGGDAYGNFDGEPGGSAGNGGNVTVTSYRNVSTTGRNSHGMLVQSYAGTGGDGGSGYIFGGGGSGGSSASGGNVDATNRGNILTTGYGANGLLVQSLGGDAGDGGDSYGIVGDAGSGSVGGNGGSAIARSYGNIETQGTFAHGIAAQSIGGNGGNSGSSGGLVAFGGDGGSAGTGGSAAVYLYGGSQTITRGNDSYGALSQSIGGGGGTAKSSGGVVAFGGSGGSGATGGTASVTVLQDATIFTYGDRSYGIMAESVGGSGGSAGGSGGVFTMGGTGGNGAIGGNVSVSMNGDIYTEGTDARGVFAQSVGGGGGNAGSAGAVVSLGASGGTGGTGGSVTVNVGSEGRIETLGDGADGVFAQSIGGGGGAGSSSGGVLAIGGRGSSGGAGGTVYVSNAGNISTGSVDSAGTVLGVFSRGIFAQSVGGGGGAGGDGGGLVSIGGSGSQTSAGGAVTVSNSGSITTLANYATAMQAQSIGGGGGDGGTSGGVLLAIGGAGGGGGEAGRVTATHSGTISTSGDDSHGIFLQAIGGGGGNAGNATSLSAFAGVAIGGSGGDGGNGGTIDLDFSPRSASADPRIVTLGDRSRGVFAQSLGGGGGSGGFAAQLSGGIVGSVSVAIGGSGGDGGVGGLVDVDGDVEIITSGDNSEGMYLQSVGGGGGAGGGSIAVAISGGPVSASVSVSIGGSGGGGGQGGTVNADSGGLIITRGNFSTGLLAQSVGGGGGTGGYSIAANAGGSAIASLGVAVGLGGSGGSGGKGDVVDVDFDGSLTTQGDDAAGAVIQSVGGGGGVGGYNISGSAAVSGVASVGVSVGLGGSGGSGGNGSSVTGEIGGDISTDGDRSVGAVVQSLGGGGGSGGFNISGTLTGSGVASGGVSVGLGGSGAGGGSGGTVIARVGGDISTRGDQSGGLVAQSTGGGGGSGSFNVSGNVSAAGVGSLGVGVGLGGSGGNGGTGGNVTASVAGLTQTLGDQSVGISAQSVGGGGGTGALNVTGNLSVAGTVSGSVGVGLGGSGGGGGSAGTVNATTGAVFTQGDQSSGVVAQSIGGGGGAGALNVTAGISIAGTASGNVGVGLGGSGGSGGNASRVDANVIGNVITLGDQSDGVVAQSIGGGGGAGALNVTGGIALSGTVSGSIGVGLGGSGGSGANAGAVDSVITGDVLTLGNQSSGAVAQSIGGGGGSGGFNVTGSLNIAGTGAAGVSVGLGGAGGIGGQASTVDMDVSGQVTTIGNDSTGALAQSIGGGGGAGGFNVSGSVDIAATGSGNVNVGLGGAGGTAGNAAAVTLDMAATNSIFAGYTIGDRSSAIVAQSLGGGGGAGGFNVAGGISLAGTASGGVSVGLGGAGAGGGNGSSVTVSVSGTTVTEGAGSDAILAQSLGGGGGAGGFNISGGIAAAGKGAGTVGVGLGGSGGGGGNAGATSVSVNSALSTIDSGLIAARTLGDDSRGIVIQSLGGGGGSGAFNVAGTINAAGTGAGGVSVGIGGSGGSGGNASTATGTVKGMVLTQGNGSDAVLVQSIGGGGGAGGFNVSAGVALSGKGAGSVAFGLGGSGGSGGDAAAANYTMNQGATDPTNTLLAVRTLGDDARGVVVQTLGGGGGSGAFNVTGQLAVASEGAGNIGVGIGGSGGNGGNASTATANVTGDLESEGDGSGAMLVQSVGGGGGAGGLNVSGGVSLSKKLAGNVIVGLGGAGGDGGDAAAVTGTLTGDVLTLGDESFGVTLQSLGGGGGQGGFNISGGIAASLGDSGAGTLGVGIGGFGGGGGNAGLVTGTITGNINTFGDGSYGALIQSLGGGGGAGGFNVTGGITASRSTSGTIGFGLGGFGGDGGNAGAVIATLRGDVTTTGADAYGALLQSLGGAGGSGAFNVTGSISFSTSDDNSSIAASIGIGGFGGGAGNASTVTGSITGDYATYGDNADGVLVQSLGGGGGAGGMNISGSVALGMGTTGTGSVGIGGFAGGGGDGADITFTRVGDTFTEGLKSDAILVQSVGGGGGTGGMNISGGLSATFGDSAYGLSFGLGGFGGDGGDAGNVTASVTGNVYALGSDLVETAATTETVTISEEGQDDIIVEYELEGDSRRENGSHGVLVQSLGGGGGSGGLNISGNLTLTKWSDSASGKAASIGIGGFGGAGGDAGTVNLTMSSGIDGALAEAMATGDSKYAVAAQSIGGGGGAGGINISGTITTGAQLTVGIGGFGGDGGIGEHVTATVDANLWATGDTAAGLLAQSIGGGGGAGGINVSGGILATNKASNQATLVFGMGGNGGAANVSGDVTVSHSGQVVIDGSDAQGIAVQSIAGGGGVGGMNVSAALSGAAGTKRLDGLTVAAGVGGTGGDGADAGSASLTSTGNIFINAQLVAEDGVDPFYAYDGSGTGSNAILVQSVGGGGGSAGLNVAAAIAPFGAPSSFALGGSGGGGGDAADVSVTRGYAMIGGIENAVGGTIMTFGDNSDALVAQSIGGGGGAASINLSGVGRIGTKTQQSFSAQINIGGEGGAGSTSGDVDVRHYGVIQTNGSGSDAILAQAIAGGGGSASLNWAYGNSGYADSFGFALGGEGGEGGDAGTVTVDHDGTIITLDDASAGIKAQSVGGGGGDASNDANRFRGTDSSVSYIHGKTGGTGGTGGSVDVSAAGTIVTAGISSNAIHAQSIGGGGGNSGKISGSLTKKDASASTSGAKSTGGSYGVSFAMGLAGATGGVGGNVSVTNNAEIYTTGEQGRGIFSQSVGGGGGTGGNAKGSAGDTTYSVGFAMGGAGGTGASAGSVTVKNNNLIHTTGSQADGILSQSVGGGGGTGGSSGVTKFEKSMNSDKDASTSVNFAMGGSGGTGGLGGLVDVANSSTIMTEGDQAYGIRAQSIGGGGGIGGKILNAFMVAGASTNSLQVTLGGEGGSGNAAGRVEVDNTGLIYTKGANAVGIAATSVGGGGGEAGSIVDITVGAIKSSTNQNRVVVNIGGAGGDGGLGGEVAVNNQPISGVDLSGTIVTEGYQAYGIFAQSLGGGGGNSSSIISASLTRGSESSHEVTLSIGAKGGAGNDGGTVGVTNGGVIETSGDGAHGILAQSVGGGGGNAGVVITASGSFGNPSGATAIGIGGFGGAGGDGKAVTVSNSGNILTSGAGAHGLVAQSIGGGGGNASMAYTASTNIGSMSFSNLLAVTIGALTGGVGGEGGDVTVNHAGDITVTGAGSEAIVAQSINGGGGSLSFTASGLGTLPYLDLIRSFFDPTRDGTIVGDSNTDTDTMADTSFRVYSGGEGTSNSASGKVTINTTGTIGTMADNSLGISNLAIGGGGGTTYLDVELVTLDTEEFPDEPVSPASLEVQLGGVDGSANAGGTITSVHSGAVVTEGTGSPGALIASIGGGGGRLVADFSLENAGLFDNAMLFMGSARVDDSSGGDITRQQDGQIASMGDFSPGAIVQSIGGGGGSAQILISQREPEFAAFAFASSFAAPTLASPVSAASFTPVEGSQVSGQLWFGASGGNGNDGGDITTGFAGGIMTLGDYSPGLVLQSIGAGGGEVRLGGVDSVTVRMGGFNGANGSGGNIALTNGDAIYTEGAFAHGIVMQSIGGGGGALFGGANSVDLILAPDNSGDGGNISLAQDGGMLVMGDGANALIVQSLGGGGGWIDGVFAGTSGGAGSGGAIDLAITGSLAAIGANGNGVWAQSLGSAGAGNITLGVTGDIRGGGAAGAGVRIDGGAGNLVTIGEQGSLSALSGLAMLAGDGNDVLVSDGITVGNIQLGGGTNVVFNEIGALFVTIDTLDLQDGAGSTGAFTNAGDLRLGLSAPSVPINLLAGESFIEPVYADPTFALLYGTSTISQVALDGDFVQSDTGFMAYDIAFGPYASDRIDATGNAVVAGAGEVTLTWLQDRETVALITTGGSGTDIGLEIADTIALDYSVIADERGILLSYASDFGQDFLTRNQQALGTHMDSALDVGNAEGIGRMMALLGNLSAGQEDLYAEIFNEFDPEIFVAPVVHQLTQARGFANELGDCWGETVPTRDGCVRGKISHNTLSREERHDGDDFTTSPGFRVSMAIEQSVGNGWSLFGGLGTDELKNMRFASSNALVEGTGWHLGAGVARRFKDDRSKIALSLSTGWQSNNSVRTQTIFEPQFGAASFNTGYSQATASFSTRLGEGELFVLPSLEASAIRYSREAFAESGLEGTGLAGRKDAQWIGLLEPTMTFGYAVAPETVITAFGGLVYYTKEDLTAPLQFIGTDPAADAATIRSNIGASSVSYGAAVRIGGLGKARVDLGYRREVGSGTQSQSANLGVAVRF